MNTIHTMPQYKGKLYGVELEIEAAGLYEMEEHYDSETDEHVQNEPCVPKGWLREQEDSIQGVELISEKPFDFNTSIENIASVFFDIERQGFKPTRTPRGSTHVHTNVADLSWEQMRSFVMACAWAEPTLIELAGKGRKGNLFAQSYETTPIGWAWIVEAVRRQEFSQWGDTHYMATSFYPMSSLGSVEFRMGPSSRTAEEAMRWLRCIDLVVTAGRETVVGLEEPLFLSFLMSKLDDKKQARLRMKGQTAAAELWYAMNEVYVKPVKKPRGSKLSDALAAHAFSSQPILSQSPYEFLDQWAVAHAADPVPAPSQTAEPGHPPFPTTWGEMYPSAPVHDEPASPNSANLNDFTINW